MEMQAFPERILHFCDRADPRMATNINQPCSVQLMSNDEKVLDFPRVEVTLEKKARRVMVEATRLANLAPGEWRLWIDRSAERLGIPRATLEDLIVAIIKDSEKKAREDKAEARRQEERVRREQEREQRERKREQEGIDKRAERNRKEKEKAFKTLISLPSEQHETRLAELAKRLDEDVAAIRDDFTAFVGMESRAASTDPWNIEPWPEPVETQALLQEISAKISKYIVLHPEAVTATVLWTMTAWAHEGSTHSPILAAISVEPDSGKSTLLGVLRFLVPKPFVSVEPTGPSVYRTVDREHPTLVIDEADDLFYRKSDLRAIVNAGWSRGTRIPRQGRWYDPFCPKILGILGKTKLPRTMFSAHPAVVWCWYFNIGFDCLRAEASQPRCSDEQPAEQAFVCNCLSLGVSNSRGSSPLTVVNRARVRLGVKTRRRAVIRSELVLRIPLKIRISTTVTLRRSSTPFWKKSFLRWLAEGE